MTEYVSFENQDEVPGYNRFADTTTKLPYLCRLVLKTGFAQNEKEANKILFIASGVFIVLAIIFFIMSLQPPSVKVIKIQARPKVAPIEEQVAEQNVTPVVMPVVAPTSVKK